MRPYLGHWTAAQPDSQGYRCAAAWKAASVYSQFAGRTRPIFSKLGSPKELLSCSNPLSKRRRWKIYASAQPRRSQSTRAKPELPKRIHLLLYPHT